MRVHQAFLCSYTDILLENANHKEEHEIQYSKHGLLTCIMKVCYKKNEGG